jgi:hypothetical protein
MFLPRHPHDPTSSGTPALGVTPPSGERFIAVTTIAHRSRRRRGRLECRCQLENGANVDEGLGKERPRGANGFGSIIVLDQVQ